MKSFTLIACACGLAMAAEPGIVQPDPSVRPAIELDGKAVDSFRVLSSEAKHVVDPEFGPGEETIEIAVFKGGGLRIERRVRTLVPERHPDATIVERSFRNLGRRPVRIGRVDTERLLLDRRLAEPAQQPWAFASYQGGAYVWGRDYELIRLAPGLPPDEFSRTGRPHGARRRRRRHAFHRRLESRAGHRAHAPGEDAAVGFPARRGASGRQGGDRRHRDAAGELQAEGRARARRHLPRRHDRRRPASWRFLRRPAHLR